jgi:BirA family biotin operon repressor/biotin-[acetyl-CoA-carboxylase] ligase
MDRVTIEQAFGEKWCVIDASSATHQPSKKTCLFYAEIDSTSDEAERLDSSYFKEPATSILLLAKKQTAGHGRLGRPWHAPEDSALTMTLLCRQPAIARPMGHIPLLVGWSILRSLGSHVRFKDLDLKWPNDILVQGKKVGGILCCTINKFGNSWLSIGIGINVGSMKFPSELKEMATSLAHHGSKPISIAQLAESIVDSLEEDLENLSPTELLKNVQSQSSICFGQEITYIEGEVEKFGTTCGLDDQGALLCRSESGDIYPLHVSEVHKVKRVKGL